MRNATIAALVATLALSSAALAEPGVRTEEHSIAVSHADLDLGTDDGASAMLWRIRSAARTVCGGPPNSANANVRRLYSACRREAIEHAVGALDAPLVTALHRRERASDIELASAPHDPR
jgi:UrcA family protein